jgi:cyclic pyranopterin phosphate synthase
MISGIDGLNCLALTTNGVRLKDLAQPLYQAGVRKINISLDTLNRDRFQQITGKDHLPQVLEGIDQAEKAGFEPIKLNTVVMRGINDDEVADLAAMTYRKPYHVRFIELMPFQNQTAGDFRKLFMPIGDIMKHIPRIENAQIGTVNNSSGPARLCILPGAIGRVGFIAPMSWHFCSTCNRLRLTADGKIRSCLFSSSEIDVKGPLRRGASKNELIDIFKTATENKPRHRCVPVPSIPNDDTRGMYAIGG